MKVLRISASPRLTASHSRKIADRLSARLEAGAGAMVTHRDLVRTPPPLPDDGFVEASLARDDERGEAQRRNLEASEVLILELEGADTVIVDMPMHNFTVPAVFKAWVDMVVRPGRTFRATRSGKVGLLADRPVILIVACGGRVSGAGAGQPDFLTPYVRQIFATIGLGEMTVIRMEGLRRGPAAVAAAEARAFEMAEEVAERLCAVRREAAAPPSILRS